jgi:aminopeptidase N
MIPVCVKSSDSKPFCQIIGQKQQTLPVSGCSQWVFTNVNAVGYYRTEYDKEMLDKLSAVATQQLSTAERMSLVSDLGALMRSGQQNIGGFLDWVAALNQDQERAIVESYSPYLDSINDYVVTPADREAYHAWVRTTFKPMMAKIGWTPAPGEKDDTRSLRADLIEILGQIGEDPETIKQSTMMARQYLKDPNSVDASIASNVLKVAAQAGDATLFDEYLAAARNMHAPEQYYNVERALSQFREPKLVERALDLSVAPETRTQDARFRIAAALNNTSTRAVAWTWVKAHWPEVETKITSVNGATIVGAARSFCTTEARDDVQQFFTEHKVASSERGLRQAVERINSCIDYHQHQQGNLASWLAQHPATVTAGSR